MLTSPLDGLSVPTIATRSSGQNEARVAKPSPVAHMSAAAASRSTFVGMVFPGPYRVPAGSFASRCIFTNTVGRTAYRGPWAFEAVAREVMLDISARRMGLDPIELRRRNILHKDELPYLNPNGMPYTDVTPLETFEHALEILDYEGFRREQERARAAGRYLGVGTCSYVEPTTTGMGMYATEGATIRIAPPALCAAARPAATAASTSFHEAGLPLISGPRARSAS